MATASIEDILDLVEILRAGVRATTAQAALFLYDTQLIKKTFPPGLSPYVPEDREGTARGHSADTSTGGARFKFSLPFAIYLGDGFLLGGYVRKNGGRGFSRKDHQLLARLVSSLEDVARVLLKGFRHGVQDDWCNIFADSQGRESFVVDNSLRIVSRSSHIEKLLGGRDLPTVVMQGRLDFTSSPLSAPSALVAMADRFIRSDLSDTTFSFSSADGRPMIAFARRMTLPEEPLETFYAFAVQPAMVDFKTMAARLGERAEFTARQLEIVEHILEGMPYPKICDTLCISTDTLKSHRRQIFRKTGVRNRTELFTAAIGLLDPSAGGGNGWAEYN